jgi:peptidyl-prolyl cis-trans isomerase B (cyclophilin B)
MRLLVLALASLALLAAGCGGGDDDEAAPAMTRQEPTTTGTQGCRQVDAPDPRDDGGAEAPEGTLDAAKTYKLVFETNCGSFTVTLDQKSAPQTAASLVKLAGDGFYDDTIIHRIAPGFVIQGGDPTQTGSGGPGYQTVDAPPADAEYTLGTMAMAKTQAEPAGTAGSQFFIVTAPDAELPPEYAIVGTVTAGLGVVERIGRLGNISEQPTQTVLVEKVSVAES